jgi:hypothetical protein
VAQPVEADEPLGPVGVAVLGARREQANTAGAAEAIEQSRRIGKGQLAHVEGEDVMEEEGEGGVGFFKTVQRVFFGLRDVFEELADIAG